MVAGIEQRFPFVIVAEDELPMVSNVPTSIDVEVLSETGEVLLTQNIAARGVGSFTPFFPLRFTPPEAGNFLVRTEFAEEDYPFAAVDRADTTLFQVGEKLPGFDSPTVDDSRGVAELCTRFETCPFHSVTLTDAVTSGMPTALLIATPAFCQTDVCGASLDFLIDAVGDRQDIAVIHSEVYADFETDVNENGGLPTRAPMLEEWDYAFEPSLFVTDSSGTIVEALHFAFDSDEVADALALV